MGELTRQTAKLYHHILERGVSSKESGTGIGLALCKENIQSHGGKIEIESEHGKGTAVTFTLPVYEGDRQDD
jgi:signal transduction histidine kinase